MSTIQEKIFFYTHPGLYKRKLEELRDTEQKVVWILNKYPSTRDSDQKLLFLFWQLNDNFTGVEDVELTPAETITRCRRKINYDYGLYLPLNPAILEGRKISALVVREWALNRTKMKERGII